jgi:hypothetical protein
MHWAVRTGLPRTIPGTGLSPAALGALVAASTALFLMYGGLLWRAAPEASHVGRFAVSYLAVPPAAALLLVAARRLSRSHLAAATGVVWGVKLVVTSVLYLGLARGTAQVPVAAPRPVLPASAPAATVIEYRSAQAEFSRGDIRGTVRRGGVPVAGAVVLLDRPLPGLPAAPAGAVTLAIAGSRYGAAAYLVPAGAGLQVTNADTRLHTLHLYDAGRAVLNMPVPAAFGPRTVAPLEPGIYEARCDTHETERAAVVVVDHPYATTTSAAGELALASVPAGPVTLVIVTGEPGAAPRRVRARVEPSLTTSVNIDLTTSEVAEERL